jgi:hypothetical protein
MTMRSAQARQDDATGKSGSGLQKDVSSPKIKNISVLTKRDSGYITAIPFQLEGRIMIVTTWDGERWTRRLRLTSAAEAYGKSVWS